MTAFRVDTTPEAIADRIRRTAMLTRAGLSLPEIAAKLKVTPRSVGRYRAANQRDAARTGR